jgi:DNA-binding transcriptional LysR family regulator
MKTIDHVSLRSLDIVRIVAATSSFSETARQLGLQRAVVAQSVAQLEAQLDTKLFQRTTRVVALTEEGEALIARIGGAVETIREGLLGTQAQSGTTAGNVTLSSSHAFGRYFVVPTLTRFARAQPEITVDFYMADRLDDLVVDRLDLAIRLGVLPDSNLIARALGALDVILVASPSLLGSKSPPKTIAALSALPAIGFRVPGSGEVYPWTLEAKGERVSVKPERVAMICNSIEGVIALAGEGAGVAAVPRAFVREALASCALKTLLPSYKLSPIPAHLVFTSRELMPKRVRLLADHLVKEISALVAKNG